MATIKLMVMPETKTVLMEHDGSSCGVVFEIIVPDGWTKMPMSKEFKTALELKKILEYKPEKKIAIIKTIRNICECGLKEAKDAFDAVFGTTSSGIPTERLPF